MSVPVSSILLPILDMRLQLMVKPTLVHLDMITQKLHIDFGDNLSIRRCMAKPADDEVRNLFTEIGCIMEDASVVALIWRDGDGLDPPARLNSLTDAHAAIGNLLAQIEQAG